MAAAVQLPPPAPSLHRKHAADETPSCPSCGTSIHVAGMAEAQHRIRALEAQMERLKEKAAAAVDKCADYEDRIRSLQAARDLPHLPRSNTAPNLDPGRPSTSSADDHARPTTASSQKQSRFSFLTSRMGSPFNPAATTSPPSVAQKDASPPLDTTLLNELERERALRAKAEARVQKVDIEIEELSVQLFSQANEMVAEERRARAKLEERIEMLEKKDKDKMARLERLEKAVSRIDRVKAMLNATGGAANGVAAGAGAGAMLAPPGTKR
ncbi:hypothetical protein ACN47E_008352 [Coniothyrium glycines]